MIYGSSGRRSAAVERHQLDCAGQLSPGRRPAPRDLCSFASRFRLREPDRGGARQARRGDRQALLELYERHRSRLLGFLIGQLRKRDAAEEVFQEVWVKVLGGIEQYRTSRGPFRAWLFRVDVHTLAIASAANIGGAASAPIVAAHHRESLVPASILMAMIGYALGNYLAILTGRLGQLLAG